MLSKIALIARTVLALLSAVKQAILAFKIHKREKLVEKVKKSDKNEQLDALDELRK